MLFQFRLGRIPVQVHFSHVLIAGLLGWMLATSDLSSPGWPGSAYEAAGHAGQGQILFAAILAWVGVIFVSVLVHELGHAVTSLAFGYQPSIQLLGMGGFTRPNARGPVPWWRDVLVTAAGPAAGLLLGLASKGASLLAPAGPVHYILAGAAGVNFYWTLLNLLPVTPLDGGGISRAIFMRVFGRRGFLFSQVLSLLVAGAVVVYELQQPGGLYVAFFVGWFGLTSVQLIMAYLRGDAPAPAPNDPHATALAQAATLYREGKLGDARRLATGALEGDPTPPVRSRLHHLLGWVALKEGQGREALDHFAQVQGRPVEPHALAAGFSLVGDDERALSLWEHAYRETHDRTILHEWAGALIRLGRAEQAMRLAGLEVGQAYDCAERVLFIRGEFARAARTGAEGFEHAPTSERAYDAACAFARAGEPEQAVKLLQRAVSLGFDDARYAETDEDLATLRGNSGFQELLARMRPASP